jgi:twinkle protein
MSTRFKDVNDCLMAGLSIEAMKACLDQARDFAPEKVRRAREYEEEFLASWFDQLLESGLELPFAFPWRIRPAETTVWTGIEKSGKTTMLSFVLMALLAQGERAMVASFEVRPVKTLKKYSRQAFGGLLYDREKLKQWQTEAEKEEYRTRCRAQALETLAWLDRGVWMYDHVGIAHWRDVLDDIRWARRRHGITQFVLDNFMRLGIAKDDYTQQADCITAIASLAQELDAHIHVVVHQTKQEGHKGPSGKRSVSGAFEIIANVHNIVEVQRDERKGQRAKEIYQEREFGRLTEEEFKAEKAKLDETPDGKFILHAQRDGEEQNGSKYLWFLWRSQQYCDHPPSHHQHGSVSFVDSAKESAAQAKQTELPTVPPGGGAA